MTGFSVGLKGLEIFLVSGENPCENQQYKREGWEIAESSEVEDGSTGCSNTEEQEKEVSQTDRVNALTREQRSIYLLG